MMNPPKLWKHMALGDFSLLMQQGHGPLSNCLAKLENMALRGISADYERVKRALGLEGSKEGCGEGRASGRGAGVKQKGEVILSFKRHGKFLFHGANYFLHIL